MTTLLQFTDYEIVNVLLKLRRVVKGKLELLELRSLASDFFLAEKRERQLGENMMTAIFSFEPQPFLCNTTFQIAKI